ncbi:MAG: hypothetical protein JXA82_17870 [Sedimentisphaerales bacterium]|nr:hypothetical protein [Sedimentisphaerales bacterium]
MGTLLVIIGILVGMVAAFAKLADYVLINDKQNEALRKNLVELSSKLGEFNYIEAIHRAHSRCTLIFDRVYGVKHFSIRCFLFSCIISIISVLTILLSFVVGGRISFGNINNILQYLLWLTLLNIFIDYFSLLETRKVLGWANHFTRWNILWLWLIDIVLSLIIFFIPFYTVKHFWPWLIQRAGIVSTGGIWPSKRMAIAMGDAPLGRIYLTTWKQSQVQICFLSTLTTSMIFWLYSTWVILIKAMDLTKRQFMHSLQCISEQKKILTAIGMIISLVILLLGGCMKIVSIIISRINF